MVKKIIKVAGAAIIDQKANKVLAGKRDNDRLVGGYWEFPGGKIEKGETPQEAVKRELKEEFNDDIVVGPQLGETVSYEYNFGIVQLTIFYAKLKTHNFDLVAHSKIEWFKPQNIENLNWAPADKSLIKKLAQTDLRSINFK